VVNPQTIRNTHPRKGNKMSEMTRKETQIKVGSKNVKVVCKGIDPSDMPQGMINYMKTFVELLKSKTPALYVYTNRITLYAGKEEFKGKLLTLDRVWGGLHIPVEFSGKSNAGSTPKGLAFWYADAKECETLNRKSATSGVIMSKGSDKKGEILTKKTLMSKINAAINK
jgi:hypothetical protein